MSALRQFPELVIQPDYHDWRIELHDILLARGMDVEAWSENWAYDFRRDYDAGATPAESAERASDHWWRALLAESWT